MSETIEITEATIEAINSAISSAIAFEQVTGKQLNITSIVGEILACQEKNLLLVKNDINTGFDAIDRQGKKVQIKTRRYKDVRSAQTGPLLDKNGEVPYDYALLVLLNVNYELISITELLPHSIIEHFTRINLDRVSKGKLPRKTMSISQFENIAKRANNP